MTQEELINLKRLIMSDQDINFEIALPVLKNTNEAVILYMMRCIKSEIVNLTDDLGGRYAYEENEYRKYYKYCQLLKKRLTKVSKLSFQC